MRRIGRDGGHQEKHEGIAVEDPGMASLSRTMEYTKSPMKVSLAASSPI
jgi:hypothetical protein